MVSFNNKYAIYIVEAEALKASEGVLISRLQNVAVATPPVRKKKKNKKPLCIVSYSTFTHHKICCALSLY
jgi:hypothetical protein